MSERNVSAIEAEVSEESSATVAGDSSDHFDFVSLVRDQAKVHGLDPEQLLWKAAKAMFDKATAGDAAAAKLLFDRCCGVQGGKTGVNVAIDNRSVNFGPPAPAAGDVGDYIAQMNKVAAQIGVHVHDAKSNEEEEIEELLS
jgi:hypothetical protein